MEINIFGASGHIKNIDHVLNTISKLEKEHNSTIQIFRADRIFGKEHLQTAIEISMRSWDRKTARGNTLAMEILLYAAAERQISEAIKNLGFNETTMKFAVVTIGQVPPKLLLDALELQQSDEVLEAEGKDHSIFDISSEELKMANVSDLVLERIALSELNR